MFFFGGGAGRKYIKCLISESLIWICFRKSLYSLRICCICWASLDCLHETSKPSFQEHHLEMEDERQRVEVRKTGTMHCSAPATSHCLVELFVKVQPCELILSQNLEIQCKVYTISTQKKNNHRYHARSYLCFLWLGRWYLATKNGCGLKLHSKATGARVEWEAGAYRAFNKHGTGAGELSGGLFQMCPRFGIIVW